MTLTTAGRVPRRDASGERVHATAVALGGAGVLLRGPSGSGKSDLALRLIDGGGRLVADDQTILSRDGATIRMTAPATIAGRLEVRGLGIVTVPTATAAALTLVVDLVAAAEIHRLPRPATCRVLGLAVPRCALAPFEVSAAAKLRVAVAAAVDGIMRFDE